MALDPLFVQNNIIDLSLTYPISSRQFVLAISTGGILNPYYPHSLIANYNVAIPLATRCVPMPITILGILDLGPVGQI